VRGQGAREHPRQLSPLRPNRRHAAGCSAPGRRAALLLAFAAAGAIAAVAATGCGSGSDSTSTTTAAASQTTSTTTNGSAARQAKKKAPEPGAAKAPAPGAPPKARVSHPGPRHHRGPPGGRLHKTYPAHILGHQRAKGGLVPPAELWPVRNGWVVSNHRMLTAVYAGANPQRPKNGRLVIFRQDFIRVTQRTKPLDVQGSGPLVITRAPHGTGRVQTSAQRRGTLDFAGRGGINGTLHLRGDTVTLDPP
jgi:hypothetical protein